MRLEEMLKINLCNTKWTIEELEPEILGKLDRDRKEDIEKLDGYTDFDTSTIYLNRKLNPHRKAVTLVHEMFHIFYDYSGFPFKNDKAEEKAIRSIEHFAYSLVKEFPKEYRNK